MLYGNVPAIARVALIEARCTVRPASAERRRRELLAMRSVPDLAACPLLARILESWSAWACAGDPVSLTHFAAMGA
jgi:hypothetical protein